MPAETATPTAPPVAPVSSSVEIQHLGRHFKLASNKLAPTCGLLSERRQPQQETLDWNNNNNNNHNRDTSSSSDCSSDNKATTSNTSSSNRRQHLHSRSKSLVVNPEFYCQNLATKRAHYHGRHSSARPQRHSRPLPAAATANLLPELRLEGQSSAHFSISSTGMEQAELVAIGVANSAPERQASLVSFRRVGASLRRISDLFSE